MRYLLFSLLLFYPSLAHALEFSEIAYDVVGADDGHEWIEVHNEASQSVDLMGYYFSDGSNHTLTLPPGKGGQGSLVLPAGGYLILADDAALFLTDHPNFSSSVVDTTMSLSNYSSTRTETINLSILAPDKTPVSEAAYSPTTKGEKGYTLELDPTNVWVDSQRVGGSPGTNRPPPQPPAPLPEIHFSEILSNPPGADAGAEAVELFNAGNQSVDINGWYLTDKPTESGNTNRHVFEGMASLGPDSYVATVLKGSFLNNKDESLSLFTADDQFVETVTLAGEAKDGYSYALINGTWQWTNELTLGSPNRLSQSQTGAVAQTSSLQSSTKPTNQLVNPSTVPISVPALTKHATMAATSPSAKLPPPSEAQSSSKPLPTGLATVAGITTTESPSALFHYLVTFLPPLFLIGSVLFYLYKKRLLFFKQRPP
jgi:hypothetical protein